MKYVKYDYKILLRRVIDGLIFLKILLLWQNNFKTKTNFSTSFIFYNTPSQSFLTFKGQKDTRNRNSNLEKWHGIKYCPYSLYRISIVIILSDKMKPFWTQAIADRNNRTLKLNWAAWNYGQNRFVYQNLLYFRASNIKEMVWR